MTGKEICRNRKKRAVTMVLILLFGIVSLWRQSRRLFRLSESLVRSKKALKNSDKTADREEA